MAGVPQPESLRQRIIILLAEVDELSKELEQATHAVKSAPLSGQHRRPQLRLIRGGKAVTVVPALWLGHTVRDHVAVAAMTVALPLGGYVAGVSQAPAEAEPRAQPIASSVQNPDSSRPAFPLPPRNVSGVTPSQSPTPLVVATPGAAEVTSAEANTDATPNLQDVVSASPPSSLLPPPAPISTPTETPTEEPTETPSPLPSPSTPPVPEGGRSSVVLECVGEPGGEPPVGLELVACVDAWINQA